MADETPTRKHPIRHILDQIIAIPADHELAPRDDVKNLAIKVRSMRNGITEHLKGIMADFEVVTGPEAADLDATKMIEAYTHLANLTDDVEKRTNAFMQVIMSQTTAYKIPPSGEAVSGEINVLKIEDVNPKASTPAV